jgi:hypothetical protein
MAYSDFTLSDLETKFGLQHQKQRIDFPNHLITPSQKLVEDLGESANMPIKSEKARSEWIVVPILRELRRLNNNFFTIYSGENLTADKEKGLIGECDFILSKDIKSYEISFPIFQIVEAKKNDLDEGIKQCASQLLGARIFNEKKGIKQEKIYGCTTTGDDWIFLELSQNLLTIDNRKYYLVEIKELLGVFQYIIDTFKP